MSITVKEPSWLRSQGGKASTVSVVDPWIAPDVAVIVLVPLLLPVASPPAAAFVHVTKFVRSCVLLSEYVPFAVNCCVSPFAIDGFTGETAIDCNAAAVT